MLSSLQKVTSMNVLLLTNFAPDNQQSMLRFGGTLSKEFSNDRNVNFEKIYPTPVFSKLPQWQKLNGLHTWIILLFPARLESEILKLLTD